MFQGCVRCGTYQGVPAVNTAGTTGTGHCRKFGAASIPVPKTSVSSVRHQYHFGKFGMTSIPVPAVSVHTFVPVPDTSVSSLRRHNTGTGHFEKLGKLSIPVRNTSVGSARHLYRYRTLRQVRYDISTGTGRFGKFGTTSIPVPAIPVCTYVASRPGGVSGYPRAWYRLVS